MASAAVAPALGPTTAPLPGSSNNSSKQPTFEFTRRKRWAELLINELSEAIALVLSPTGRILFCTPSVTELLGWRDQELIDGEFVELINAEDRQPFIATLASAIQHHTDVLAYVRLRAKDTVAALQSSLNNQAGVLRDLGDYGYAIPTAGSSTSVPAQPPQMLGQALPDAALGPKEVLFEITGYPHFVEPDDVEREQQGGFAGMQCKCLFAVAKPYPSRNTAMLNTFLELKMENERLQQRLVDIKSRPRNGNTGSHKRPSQNRSDAQPQRPSLSPIVPHPYSHHGQQPQLSLPQPSSSTYGSVPVAMQMPMSSLASTGGSAGNNGYPSSTYAPHSGSFYSSASTDQGFGDYGVGLGLGTPGGGYAAYGQSSSSSGLAALAMASGMATGAPLGQGDKRMSFSAPSGATDHRRMSLPGGVPEARERGEEDDGGRKKKARRHVGEQFVCRTCGRTDSPEWRKGPLGPKTLCNACGLRWAKQVRKGDDKDKDETGGAE